MEFDIVLAFLAVILICKIFINILDAKTKKVYPSGPLGLPVVGHLPFLGKYPAVTLQKWRKKYGNVFRMRMGSWDTLVLNGYGVIKAAADFDHDVFSDRLNFVSFSLQRDVNRGIYTLTSCPFNETYLRSRKTTATFLRQLTMKTNPKFDTLVASSVNTFLEMIISNGKKGPISVETDINRVVGTILYKEIYGRGKAEGNVDERVDKLIQMTDIFLKLASGSAADVIPWMKYLTPTKMTQLAKAIEAYRDFDDEELRHHKETFNPDNIEDIADRVIEFEMKMKTFKDTDTDPVCLLMYNNLKDMYGAGLETTASTLLWLTLYMIAYPEIQHNVQKEIDDVVGRERDVMIDDSTSLPYTMAVINETMRLTSIVPFAIPHRASRDTKFMGYNVDEGTYVIFNTHSINHDPEYWGDPDNFRPERLLDENGLLDKKTCMHVVPFGLGRRRCVGQSLAKMHLFAIFASLMQRCELLKPDDEILDLSPNPGLIYFPKHFRVIVKDRRERL